MRLTKNNIAYVRENFYLNGKRIFVVQLKSFNFEDVRFYETDSIYKLPKSVYEFINCHKREIIENDKHFNSVCIYK